MKLSEKLTMIIYLNLFLQEVDLALAADIGTLQRMPKIMGGHRYVCIIKNGAT